MEYLYSNLYWIIPAILFVAGIIVQIILFDIKRKDTANNIKEQSRISIRPMIVAGGGGRGGGEQNFYSDFTIKDNPVTNVYLENLNYDSKIMVIYFQPIKSIEKNGKFQISGRYLTTAQEFTNYKYTYSIVFSDIEGNKYIATVEAKDCSAYITKCVPYKKTNL